MSNNKNIMITNFMNSELLWTPLDLVSKVLLYKFPDFFHFFTKWEKGIKCFLKLYYCINQLRHVWFLFWKSVFFLQYVHTTHLYIYNAQGIPEFNFLWLDIVNGIFFSYEGIFVQYIFEEGEMWNIKIDKIFQGNMIF